MQLAYPHQNSMFSARKFTFWQHYDEFYDLLGISTIHEILKYVSCTFNSFQVFMEPLKKIQVEGFAMFAEPELLFGNLDELCCVSDNTVNIEGYVMCLFTKVVRAT
jgi:hypothetical protein